MARPTLVTLRLLCGLLALAALLPAQNLPFPRRKKSGPPPKELMRTIEGTLRRNDPELIVLEPKDHRLIRFRTTTLTKFLTADGSARKSSDYQPGDHVQLEFYEDDDRNLFAAQVVFLQEGSAAERRAAAAALDDNRDRMDETEKRPDDGPPVFRRSGSKPSPPEAPSPSPTATATAPPEPSEEAAAPSGPSTTVLTVEDDPDKPRLRRGPPPKRAPRPDAPPVLVAEARPVPPRAPEPPVDPADLADRTVPANSPVPGAEKIIDPIDRARIAHTQLDQVLPNYTAQQITIRYESDTPKTDWKAQDTVTADLFFENGAEQYRNVKLNGKLSKGKVEEGTWSVGEFSTVLRDIFASVPEGGFYLLRKETFNGREATLHSFTVPQYASNWLLKLPSQTMKPAYGGRLWIDKETGRVLRVEMQARGLPEDFPLSSSELSAEAELVRLGQQTFILPVRSDILSCFRGSYRCVRNSIEFRNYKKFGAESSITFDVVK